MYYFGTNVGSLPRNSYIGEIKMKHLLKYTLYILALPLSIFGAILSLFGLDLVTTIDIKRR